MKSLLVASWGENQTEIIPTYVSSGLAFEVTPTKKLAPILFELYDDRTYIIDASFQFLNIFDKNTFIEQIELSSVIANNTIKSFNILNLQECILLVSNRQSVYHLIHWNFQTKEKNTILLGSYQDVQFVPSPNKESLYYWTKKENYIGILWQFETADLKKMPIKFDQLPFSSLKFFEKEDRIMGTNFFDELNLRGLISVDLKTALVQEKVCSKELYGPLLYPFGIDQAGNLFTYGLPNEKQAYGTIYKINKEGILKENKTFHSSMNSTFLDPTNTLLTHYQSWKVLEDGTIVVAVMTTEKLHIIALN